MKIGVRIVDKLTKNFVFSFQYFTQNMLNADDDKDGSPGGPAGMFKMGPNSGGRMFGPGGMQKSNSNNPMLLQVSVILNLRF